MNASHDRRTGELASVDPEHRLEGQILRGAVHVDVDGVGRLEPTLKSGQFPTLWSPEGKARYLDLLMHHNGEPWAVDLKVTKAGRGKYIRHAVAQAVLYRHFVHTASALHPWFEERDLPLAATHCRGAIAFPGLTGKGSDLRRVELARLAALFDIAVAELDVNVYDLPPDIPEPALPTQEDESAEEPPDYRVVVRFATTPDDAHAIAAEISPLLGDHELTIVEDDDIEVTVDVFAPGVFAAARVALDRVQSALGESTLVAPELLNVDVEGIFRWAEQEEPSPEPEPQTGEPTELDREALASAIAALPEREKLVITFMYFEQQPIEAVAQVLGLSVAEVEAIHKDALVRLHGHLE